MVHPEGFVRPTAKRWDEISSRLNETGRKPPTSISAGLSEGSDAKSTAEMRIPACRSKTPLGGQAAVGRDLIFGAPGGI